jgi:hypothetical protein
MTSKFINSFKTTLQNDDGERLTTLIWGDSAHVLEERDGRAKVQARGYEGWVAQGDLGDESLLEIYVIDVGQGDGVLIKTPDGKWHLMDAGIANRDQMTQKGTANFLRWKFQDDLLQQTISLANVIVSHPDYDHYGGLLDVLSGQLADGRTFPIEVDAFYHNGLGRFASAPTLGDTAKGEVAAFPQESHGVARRGTFIVELLDGPDSFANPARPFSKVFAELATLVAHKPRAVRRLSADVRFLPGYAPGESSVTIQVLGPILETCDNGVRGLRVLESSDSKTVNGHSIVLRLDFGQARILLTGDLNLKSQQLLRSYHPDVDFAVDVAKACHHGSEDVDLAFVRALQARATVISSGDNEDYSHPRPLLIGASARYGRESQNPEGDLQPPLVYSTELARSIKLGFVDTLQVKLPGDPDQARIPVEPANAQVFVKEWRRSRTLKRTPISTDLIYGLINVRTDGHFVLCATMREKGNDFDVKVFEAGVDVS